MNNYIPDVNSYKLAGPPSWWLRALWTFDDSLVVVPSRQGFYYRLAQRRKLNLTNDIINDALFNESDTKMLASYSLVPVTTIMATANWSNPTMFEQLRQRSVHRMGGAEKVDAMLKAQERKEQLDITVEQNALQNSLSKDAWNLYLKKIGLRSHMWSPKTSSKTPQQQSPLIKIG
jgi:hypothetical protein